MPHLALLGDSIIDNAAYTSGGPAVVDQVRELLPEGWKLTLGAVDGSTTQEMPQQLFDLAPGVTHIVLSIGGNDAIMNADLLDFPVQSSSQVLLELGRRAKVFELAYRKVVEDCLSKNAHLTLCTIYNGNFADPAYQQAASTALMVFNDAILRVAFENRLPVIDLRLVCSEPSDFANPIEPSSKGGEKIARAIAKTVLDVIRQSPRETVIIT